jgi:hypothetical protein
MVDNLSQHAVDRMKQRGFRQRDAQLVIESGTPTDDGVILTRRDVAELIAEHRAKISELERLRGAAVFLAGGKVVSMYRPHPRKARRMVRDRRSRVRTRTGRTESSDTARVDPPQMDPVR